MYAEAIIQRRVDNYEQATGVRLREVPLDRVKEIRHYLDGKLDAKGQPVRPRITPELRAFIDNELAMCKANFLYWARRYAHIERRIGTGGIALFEPLESQLVLLAKMARDEVEMWYRKDQGDTKFFGLCYIIHKARQLGFTTLCQLLLLHLDIFYSDYRNLTASVNDQMTQDVHAKWDLAYTRLPWWMQTPIASREKDRGKVLANGSYCALQDFSQEGGLGQGMTWSACHLTEIASVPDEYVRQQILNHFEPSLADTIRVIAFMESTAQGAGNMWHQIWEQVDAGRFGRWKACFVPAYAEPTRWSRPYVPDGWQPKPDTLAYADKIRNTSEKYMGYSVEPDPKHLVWWEEEYQKAMDTGTLNLFLADYCVTPEESFQYAQGGAFQPQVLSGLDSRVDRPAVAYELVTTPSQRQAVRERMNTNRDAPRIYTAGPNIDLVPVHTTERDIKDPRGLILLFEPPRLDVTYSVGADPAVGLVGWNRRFRRDDMEELNRDNACASGWYRDPKTGLLVQSFEFAGPVAAREFATYCYALGKVFGGANGPERGAPLIIELNNGGVEVQNVLYHDLRYYSLWQRMKSDGVNDKQLESWGWISSQSSVQELWVYGKDMLEQPVLPVRPRSRYLLKEMHIARWDPLRRRGEVPEGNGQHDDRIVAMLLALWQLRGVVPVGTYGELAKQIVSAQKRTAVDFQEMDIVGKEEYDRVVDEWYFRMEHGW